MKATKTVTGAGRRQESPPARVSRGGGGCGGRGGGGGAGPGGGPNPGVPRGNDGQQALGGGGGGSSGGDGAGIQTCATQLRSSSKFSSPLSSASIMPKNISTILTDA